MNSHVPIQVKLPAQTQKGEWLTQHSAKKDLAIRMDYKQAIKLYNCLRSNHVVLDKSSTFYVQHTNYSFLSTQSW